jgi:excisionase family DNA binding protein
LEARFLTTLEAARLARVSPRTIRNWVRDKYLTAVRVGPRLYRIPLVELEQLLKTEDK